MSFLSFCGSHAKSTRWPRRLLTAYLVESSRSTVWVKARGFMRRWRHRHRTPVSNGVELEFGWSGIDGLEWMGVGQSTCVRASWCSFSKTTATLA